MSTVTIPLGATPYPYSGEWYTLANGQLIPIRRKRNGVAVFDWNAVYPTAAHGAMGECEFRDLVMAVAESSPDTYWDGGCPDNYGHDELHVTIA
jgi:hypothetical protein